MNLDSRAQPSLAFHGGMAGALAPFGLFLAGVAWLGIAGAPDERGMLPVLLASIALGVLLARDRSAYGDAVVDGMSRRVVALMIVAWLFAGQLAALLLSSGFLEALAHLCGRMGLDGGAFVATGFLLSAALATAIGTSLGTLILTVPLLFPVGLELGSSGPVLLGALLGGATFGDNVSPISDTTIATASTQRAAIGDVVRSRMRYALPAAAGALAVAVLFGGEGVGAGAGDWLPPAWSWGAVLMGLGPTLSVVSMLRGGHLVTSLALGVITTCAVGLGTGALVPAQLLSIDADNFVARGLLLDGIERGVGLSLFTLLLLGLVEPIQRTDLLQRMLSRLEGGPDEAAPRHARRRAEAWSVSATSVAVLLTTHAVVAILTVGDVVRGLGERGGVPATRRANLMDLTVSIYPYVLPYFIPTILAASLARGAAPDGAVSPFRAGLFNAHSWGLLVMLFLAVALGFGRKADREREP